MEFYRGRRLRSSAALRGMVRETSLSGADLIMPYFVIDTEDEHYRSAIDSMPGQFQLSPAELVKEVGAAVANGLRAVLLFGIPKSKDPVGSEAYADDGIVQKAVRMLKKAFPDLIVVTDVCLCEYTSHGHCGIIRDGDTIGRVVNDPTLDLLAKTALSHVRAGADIVAPSDMMDGRVQAIRAALDEAGFTEIPIMSYSVKYASAYYGPFRDAAEGAPKFGDRRTYQMDTGNVREAFREMSADIEEGADMFIVKPAGPYQDVIRLMYDSFDVPLVAYQVSGEYSLIKAAAGNGWINEEAVALESLTGLRRSGAKLIITYYAAEALAKGWIKA
ncbi:MAG: porphobilinogen synthase [Mailhella sp.]|nr:porphobilinogen synthase [Mailhella sp.]